MMMMMIVVIIILDIVIIVIAVVIVVMLIIIMVPGAEGSSAISLPPFLLASPDTAGPPAFYLFPVALLVLPIRQREIKVEGPDVQVHGAMCPVALVAHCTASQLL